MELRYRITAEDRDAISAALAASDERIAVYMTTGAVGLAALTFAMPFSATSEGWVRLLVGMILALLAITLTHRVISWWWVQRTRFFPLPTVIGLEPGHRKLAIALESVQEISVLGERIFRWRAFEQAAETEKWIALRVSDRECLAIPRSALKQRGLSEAEVLASLMGRGEQ